LNIIYKETKKNDEIDDIIIEIFITYDKDEKEEYDGCINKIFKDYRFI
jgi:hypothetical protein